MKGPWFSPRDFWVGRTKHHGLAWIPGLVLSLLLVGWVLYLIVDIVIVRAN